MSDLDLINGLHKRCLHLLVIGGGMSCTIENVKIELCQEALRISIIGEPKSDKNGNVWRSTHTVYDTRSPVQDQLITEIRDHVIPVLQRRMVLDDLSDV